MKVFGREPAAFVAVIEAVLALLVVLGVGDLSAEQAALVLAVVVAVFGVVTAYLTKDTMLGVLTGLTKATIALLIGFGFDVSVDLTASIVAVVAVLVGFFQRTQTSPAETPSLHASAPPLDEAA